MTEPDVDDPVAHPEQPTPLELFGRDSLTALSPARLGEEAEPRLADELGNHVP